MKTIAHAFHWKRLRGSLAVPAWLAIGWGFIEALHTLGYIGDHVKWLATPTGNLFVILFGFVWLFAVARWPQSTSEHKNEPPSWCAEMAADDAKNMRERVFAIWDDPQPQYFGVADPFITFRVTFENATIFRLTSESEIEGETFYAGQPLKDAPKIVNHSKLTPLVLKHGARIPLTIRQPLSREVAQRLNEQRGHVKLDFSKVCITFRVEGEGAPSTFRLCGEADVTVANRD